MISRLEKVVCIFAVLFAVAFYGIAFAQDNSEEVPAVNCQEALRNLNSNDYYCKWPNRPPVKKIAGQEVVDKEKSYEFHYTGEVQTASGNTIEIEGNYFGRHKSYDEACKACENEAKRSTRLHSPADHITNLECKPTSLDGEPVY